MEMRARTVLTALLVVAAAASPAAKASGSGSLTSVHGEVRWHGEAEGFSPLPELCPVAACDEFTLTVDLPSDVWASPGGVQVAIRWQDENQDLDLSVYGPDGTLAARSAGPVSSAESALLRNAPNGVYRVLVVPWLAEPTDYEGVAEVEYLTPVEPLRELRPDMISLQPRNLRFQTSAYLFEAPVPSAPNGCYPEETLEQGAMRCLRFDQIIANVGHGPFELRFRMDGIGGERPITQRIYRSDGTYSDRFADTYEFHPAHAHFHYTGFARSHLWRADAAGHRLDPQPIRSGRKNGFCMVDVENVGFGESGDAPRTYIPPGCLFPTEADPETGAVSAISGISVGWADVYNWYLADQFIDVAGLPDAYYLLENVADPNGTVVEVHETNNGAEVLIRICGDAAEIVGGEPACPA